jgi:hypothetical protein
MPDVIPKAQLFGNQFVGHKETRDHVNAQMRG